MFILLQRLRVRVIPPLLLLCLTRVNRKGRGQRTRLVSLLKDDPDLAKRSLVFIAVPYFVGKLPAVAFITTGLDSAVRRRTGKIARRRTMGLRPGDSLRRRVTDDFFAGYAFNSHFRIQTTRRVL